jgi:alkylation response protein AidB-like acyl-CoA dehydrogenase
MRFAFTDDQLALRDGVRDVLAKECSPAHLRDAWANETGRIPGLWATLSDLGVVSLLAPEDQGGLGLSMIDLILVLEETGRVALPEPIVETAAIAVPILASFAPDALASLLAHGTSAAVTIPEAPYAVWADTAATILDVGIDGVRVVPSAECTLVAHPSVDGARRLFEVTLPGAPVIADVRASGLAFRAGVLGSAAQLLGLTDRMIEMTVDYAKERRQFGVAIGTFQAVKHHLANARLALEFARPLVYRAAVSITTNDPARSLHASMAKAAAGDAALTTARVALQVHGAIGYTTEYDLHLYMKRAWALAASWGDAAWHRAAIGKTVLDAPVASATITTPATKPEPAP